jgi:hypothetical protein
VQRILREMTAGEVMAALAWSQAEVDRLEAEAALVRWIAEAVEEGRMKDVEHVTYDELEAAALTLRQAGEACMRHGRLMHLVRLQMPKWHGSKVRLGEALKKWWPGRRAA